MASTTVSVNAKSIAKNLRSNTTVINTLALQREVAILCFLKQLTFHACTHRGMHIPTSTQWHTPPLAPPPPPSFPPPPTPIYLLQCLIQNYWVRRTFQRTVWLWGKHFYKVCTLCYEPTLSVRTRLAMESTPRKNRSCGLGACLCHYTQQEFPAPQFLSKPQKGGNWWVSHSWQGTPPLRPDSLSYHVTMWHASNPRRIKSTKVRSSVFNFRIKSTKLISPNESESNKLTI